MSSRLRPALLLVMLTAMAVRLWGIGFGLPYIVARPDETEIAGPAVGFLSGDLRPPFFEWPTLFAYAVSLAYIAYYAMTRPFASYRTLAAFAESRRQSVAPFLYVSRALSACMGVTTVWWTFAICRRLFDETVGLVAALFLALCVLHVRDSHFGTTDVPMTALAVLTVLLILRWRETGTLTHAAAAGFAGGLASSTKYNGLGVCVPFAVAAIERLVDERSHHTTARAVRLAAAAVAVFVVALAGAFFATSPYVLIDWSRFVTSMTGVESHLLQGHGVDLGRGWWYYARVVLPAAVGWPMLIAAAAGVAGLAVMRFRDAALLFSFPVAYYLVAGRGLTVFARYMLPVVPFLCMAAAWAVVEAGRALARITAPAAQQALIGVAAAAVVAPTAYATIQLDRLFTVTDNRIVVARALSEILPSDSVLYQSGERYGYVPMVIDGREIARVSRYDESTGSFAPPDPEWLLLQRSPLPLYSSVPASLSSLVQSRYELVRRFPTGDDRPGRIYDQQDAFFLPLRGLDGLTRPGPRFELYRKRAGISPAR